MYPFRIMKCIRALRGSEGLTNKDGRSFRAQTLLDLSHRLNDEKRGRVDCLRNSIDDVC